MKRVSALAFIGLSGVFILSLIGVSQQAPAPAPAIPGAGAAPRGAAAGGRGVAGQAGGGGRGGGQQEPQSPLLANYKFVTAERLKKPEDSDWLSVRRTYDGWGYSPLDEIKRGNVDKLQLQWVVLTGRTTVMKPRRWSTTA